jgi:D-alanyl-D-alanine carboxypeptidase
MLVAAVGTSVPAAAQHVPRPVHDSALEAQLQHLVAPFQGTVGIYVRNLKTGRYAAIRADEVFPTASMIKVPIVLTLFQQIEDGRLGWLDTLTYRDSLLYSGEDDLLGKLRDSTPIPLAQVAMLSITTSDNTAALWLQKLVGTGTAINAWLAAQALSQVPPWTQAASKQGSVDHSRSEVVLVNAPSGDYVFSVITKGQADSTYVKANEGYVLLRRVSALLWATFEPRHPWTPAPGVARFKP